MKEKLRALAVGAVIASATLWLADRALGWAGYPSEPPLPVVHAPRHTESRKSLEFSYTIRTNSRGIRYPETPLQKPENEFRVVVLGDSFTEGMGVEAEHAFPAYLEKEFSDAEKKVLFINCGLIGAGPEEYARILDRVGFPYQPDLVLLVLYANDVADTTVMSAQELETGQGWLVPRTTLKKEEEKRKGPKAVFHGILPRIYTLLEGVKEKYTKKPSAGFMADALDEARKKGVSEQRIDEWVKSLPPELARAAEEKRFDAYMLVHGLVRPDIWVESLDIAGDAAQEKWRTAEALLDWIARACRDRGVALGIVYAPSPIQYDPTYVSPSASVGTVIRGEWVAQESEFEKRLAGWTSRQDLLFLNMTPAFRSAAAERPGSLNFTLDPHWTPAGHELAAATIASWLREGNRVPE